MSLHDQQNSALVHSGNCEPCLDTNLSQPKIPLGREETYYPIGKSCFIIMTNNLTTA